MAAPVVHMGAQVDHVIRDGGAQAQVAHAVVAGRVLAGFIAQADDGGAPIKGHHPHLWAKKRRGARNTDCCPPVNAKKLLGVIAAESERFLNV